MKRILLIATGGTIASTEDGNGLSPALTGEELAQSVPEISGLCELDVVQPMNIDSTNMRPSDWMRIRDVIVEGYADHDGFVILHGTDTMSYTAAALSYLIQDSPKPIVLTGSQKPMGNPFTDAKLNLYQSLLYALDEHSHDVSIVFGGVAIAGTRARKQRTMSFNAFISVNYPPIAYIRNDRIVRNGLHGTHQGENPVRFYDSIDPRVFVLKLTPGVNPGILDAPRLPFAVDIPAHRRRCETCCLGQLLLTHPPLLEQGGKFISSQRCHSVPFLGRMWQKLPDIGNYRQRTRPCPRSYPLVFIETVANSWFQNWR